MKYYLIGIKGAGLSSLALILHNLGHSVVGYDDETKHQFTQDKLIELGIKIYADGKHRLPKDTIVIRSTAINENTHPEMMRAKAKKLKIYEYNEFLGELTKQFKTIAVAGCHGKTTTTSMLKTVLDPALGCNYLVGDGTGYAEKENELFVIEACEYRRNFLAYHPIISIITNIDLDHVDYYKDLDDVKDAFESLAKNTKDLLVIYGDDANSRSIKVDKPVIYYGLKDNNDLVAKDICYDNKGMAFNCYFKGKLFGKFILPFFGEHLLLNALAVISVSHHLGLKPKVIQANLQAFKGANRRFQEQVAGSNIIIDDYAHHPKEVTVTIEAVRQKYPDKKLVAIFEPHTFSRTKEFAKEIANALSKADEAYVLDIFKSRENPDDYPDITSDLILKDLSNGKHLPRESELLLKYEASVLLFMSPKPMEDIIERVVNCFKEKD